MVGATPRAILFRLHGLANRHQRKLNFPRLAQEIESSGGDDFAERELSAHSLVRWLQRYFEVNTEHLLRGKGDRMRLTGTLVFVRPSFADPWLPVLVDFLDQEHFTDH